MAATYRWTADQGATWNTVFTYAIDGTPVDITGYTARMQVRSTVDATSTIASFTTTGGTIVLGGSAGTITMNVTATATAAIAAGSYVYDLEIVSGAGVVTRLLQGPFVVSAEVTR